MPSPEQPVIVILGPTAVGKTDLSIALAELFDGEIVSVDSRLFYRGMDIGTAKPTLDQRARVPHHLIDVTNPDDTWSLAVFQLAAAHAITDIHQRRRLPFLVGGTGQYLQAVLEGWDTPPQQPDLTLRGVLEGWADEIGAQALHQRLAVIDPAAAQRIDYRNVRRTIRAFEVIFHTGRRFSDQRVKKGHPYSVLQIGLRLPRTDLYQRVDQRIEAMFTQGFEDEVHQLLAQGYDPHLPSLSAIGYCEVIQYLQGKITRDEAAMLIKRRTRQFIRRQANWFKESDPNIHWFNVGPDSVDEITTLIHAWLSHLS